MYLTYLSGIETANVNIMLHILYFVLELINQAKYLEWVTYSAPDDILIVK